MSNTGERTAVRTRADAPGHTTRCPPPVVASPRLCHQPLTSSATLTSTYVQPNPAGTQQASSFPTASSRPPRPRGSGGGGAATPSPLRALAGRRPASPLQT